MVEEPAPAMAAVLVERLRRLDTRPPRTSFRAQVWTMQDDRLFVKAGDPALAGVNDYLQSRDETFGRLGVGPRSQADYSDTDPRTARRHKIVPLAVAQWRAWTVARVLSVLDRP